MAGFDLPEECPECGYEGGWYVDEDQSLFIKSDGSAHLGGGNSTRYGQKLKARCNNRDCDAVVNIYVEAEAVNNGRIESTGAKQLLERAEEHDLLPEVMEVECSQCGDDFLAEADYRLAGDAGIKVTARDNCGCENGIRGSGIFKTTVAHIEPDQLEEMEDVLPPKRTGDTE